MDAPSHVSSPRSFFVPVTSFDLAPPAQQWINLILIWTGFGILVGLLAKALVPGRQPVGPVGTLLAGMVGSVIGPLALTLLWRRDQFNPISPLGFFSAIAGALLLLAAYHILTPWLFQPKEEDDRAEEEEEIEDEEAA
jgi:uncharacterized membrane protein YeaQ/YmgE (transglycosylase-associated protein family)